MGNEDEYLLVDYLYLTNRYHGRSDEQKIGITLKNKKLKDTIKFELKSQLKMIDKYGHRMCLRNCRVDYIYSWVRRNYNNRFFNRYENELHIWCWVKDKDFIYDKEIHFKDGIKYIDYKDYELVYKNYNTIGKTYNEFEDMLMALKI